MHAYAIEALSKAIPRILCLLDKNPLSSSYGCLDRRYWQYKMQDFPSAMQQELSRVLAWAWAFPGTRWHGAPRLATYARAAVNFTARFARHDGSLDDYFPYERALGATAYVAAAVTDACRLLGFKPEGETLAGLARMGHFLARHRERGILTNHHAIAALALFDLAAMLNDSTLRHAGEEKIALLKALQSKEGWFPEYEGCDIGYQTVTLEFLARLAHCHPGAVPLCMLERLLSFLRNFVHPDGSLGGEYGSRNTYNFYPGGFALLSSTSNDAATMLGFYLASVHSNTIN
ncbi:MAG: hypothetical protein IJU65_06370, partial [Desulfovibrio sp.]|nr:hypothetical protein [Desulfovibrio sp.]